MVDESSTPDGVTVKKQLRLATLFAIFTAGCGPPPGPVAVGDCPTLPGDVHDRARPWTLVFTEVVDPARALDPRTDAEHTIFRHTYEGLVDVDCHGDLVPRLAESWTSSEGDSVWTFELAPDRVFDDGSPVDAISVLRLWRQRKRDARGRAHLRPYWKGLRLPESRADGNRLVIRLAHAAPDLPYRIAAPEFYVLRPDTAGGWPIGTRGRRPNSRDVPGGVDLTFPAGGNSPSVTFRIRPEADPRDLFGDDTDALITRNRDALRYLAALPETRLTPLPWTRRYVLSDPAGAFPWVRDLLPEFPRELVRDVLASVARAPFDPPGGKAPEPRPSVAFSLRYPRRDADAGAIAERVVSLAARRDPDAEWIVVPATRASVAAGETPSVVVLPRTAFDPPPGVSGAERTGVDGNFLTLVETRAHFVSRNNLAGIRFGWDGVPRLDDAGWARESTP